MRWVDIEWGWLTVGGMSRYSVLVVGVGAAGYFAAIAAAERLGPGGRVGLCEATAHPLA